MKYRIWIKDVYLGVFCGLWHFFTELLHRVGEISSVYSFSMVMGFGSFELNPYVIMLYIYHLSPLFILQILYGIRIYKHFCTAGIYYIGRCVNRKKWFLSEVCKHAMHCILFEISHLLTLLLMTVFFSKSFYITASGMAAFFYLFLFELLSFFDATILINILSLRIGNVMSGILTIGIQIFSCIVLILFITPVETGIINAHPFLKLLLLINPAANSMLGLHESSFPGLDISSRYVLNWDLNLSVFYWVFLILLLLISGIRAADKYEFLNCSA